MLDDATDSHPLFHGAPKSTGFKKLSKRIVQNVREAVGHCGMVERRAPDAPVPNWQVCLPGGNGSSPPPISVSA